MFHCLKTKWMKNYLWIPWCFIKRFSFYSRPCRGYLVKDERSVPFHKRIYLHSCTTLQIPIKLFLANTQSYRIEFWTDVSLRSKCLFLQWSQVDHLAICHNQAAVSWWILIELKESGPLLNYCQETKNQPSGFSQEKWLEVSQEVQLLVYYTTSVCVRSAVLC